MTAAKIIPIESLPPRRLRGAMRLLKWLHIQKHELMPISWHGRRRRAAIDLANANLRVIFQDPSDPGKGLLISCHAGPGKFFADLAAGKVPGLSCWPGPRVAEEQ